MSTDPALDQLSREELVARARTLGARRPEVMTRVELRDEIVRLSETDPTVRRRSRGWLGVARDLVASVMDAGLNMPGAAAAIRGDARPAEETTGPPPVATLTLAEIYLAQGHTDRALATLEEVLVVEPEHAAALALRERIANEHAGVPARRRPPPSEPSSAEAPFPAPAPFVAAPQPSFVASVPAPEATRTPEVVVSSHFEEPAPTPTPQAAPAPAGVPAPTPARELSTVTEASSPISQPVPTLAAPPPLEEQAEEPAPRAEVALFERDGRVDGLYSLPPNASGIVLRVAWVVPGRDGTTQGQVDVPLDPVQTSVSLPSVERSACVRAALGREVAGTFKPLAVAWVYRAEARGLRVSFAAPGGEPAALRAQAQSLALEAR